MSNPRYPTSCPKCGAPLEVVDQGPEAAPWLCRPCRRGWWAAELSTEARALFRSLVGDHRPKKAVQAAVRAEVEQARQRGRSLRSDQGGPT